MILEKIVLFINDYINPIAIMITALSMILFIVGKIITSTRGNWNYTEKIIYCPNDDILEKYNIIYNYKDCDTDGKILLVSNETLYNVKLIILDEKLKPIGKPIIHIKKLLPNEGVYIQTYFPCGIPQFCLMWDKYNYMRAYFYLGEDGKTGYGNNIKVQYKKTWRTFIYHFLT